MEGGAICRRRNELSMQMSFDKSPAQEQILSQPMPEAADACVNMLSRRVSAVASTSNATVRGVQRKIVAFAVCFVIESQVSQQNGERRYDARRRRRGRHKKIG